MKKIIFTFLLVLLIPVLSFSQQNMTVGVCGGIMNPMGNFADGFKTSPTIGAEGYYPIATNIDIFADIAYSFLSLSNPPPSYSNESYYYLEATSGIRYNFMPLKEKIFVELGIGSYTFGVKYTYRGLAYDNNTTNFGINGGFGGILPLGSKFELMGKAKLHDIFTPGSSTMYFGLTAGINYKL